MKTISVIIPSFNQVNFITRTLDSLIQQTIKPDQIIVIDGNSTDGTVELIRKKYMNYIDVFLSENDDGQSDAINKGLKYVETDLVGWVNSDDILENNTIELIKIYSEEKNFDCYWGIQGIIDHNDRFIGTYPFFKTFDKLDFLYKHRIPVTQPGSFFSTVALRKYNYFVNTNLHFCMDWDLYLRMNTGCFIPFITGYLRRHKSTKTYNKSIYDLKESLKVFFDHGGSALSKKYLITRIALF